MGYRYARPCFALPTPASHLFVLSGTRAIPCHHCSVRPFSTLFWTPSLWGSRKRRKYISGLIVLLRYYRGAVGVLLVFDVTRHSSFSNIKTLVEELREYADPNIVIILIGNKTDLNWLRVVSTEVAESFASAFSPLL